jgi:hypothetical protein
LWPQIGSFNAERGLFNAQQRCQLRPNLRRPLIAACSAITRPKISTNLLKYNRYSDQVQFTNRLRLFDTSQNPARPAQTCLCILQTIQRKVAEPSVPRTTSLGLNLM